jgi:hypothetical protein
MADQFKNLLNAFRAQERMLKRNLREFQADNQMIEAYESLINCLNKIPRYPGDPDAGTFGDLWTRRGSPNHPCISRDATREIIEELDNPLFNPPGKATCLNLLRAYLHLVELLCAIYAAYQAIKEVRETFEKLVKGS